MSSERPKLTAIPGKGARIYDISGTEGYLKSMREVAFAADRLLEALDPDCAGPSDLRESMDALSDAIKKWAELDEKRYPDEYITLVIDGDLDSHPPKPRAA